MKVFADCKRSPHRIRYVRVSAGRPFSVLEGEGRIDRDMPAVFLYKNTACMER